ncbi:MAG: hypothetical protein KDB35_17515 [Acidimicrobiales bacterium]|nr:hypothetical protein [Acidimicrobiales bacterium]
MSSRQHVARFDFDELLESWVWASSRPAGPAGDLPLRLGGGVQVEFDAADPARVVRVDIEAAPLDSELRPVGEAIAASSRDAATRALFGDGAWGFSAPGSSVEIPLDRVTGLGPRLARLARLDDQVSTLASPVGRGLAAVECLQAACRLPDALITPDRRRELSATAVEALDATALGRLAAERPETAATLADVVADPVLRDLVPAHRWRSQLAHRSTPTAGDQRRSEGLGQRIVATLAAVRQELLVSLEIRPGLVFRDERASQWHRVVFPNEAELGVESGSVRWRRDGRELLVDAKQGDASDECWVRVYDAGLELLAQAPFVAGDDRAQAQLLVHPDDEVAFAALTDRPSLWDTSDVMALHAEALRAAAVALWAERTGDRSLAAAWWEDCSALWDALGDETKAELASAYADQAVKRQRRTGRGRRRRARADRDGPPEAPTLADQLGP